MRLNRGAITLRRGNQALFESTFRFVESLGGIWMHRHGRVAEHRFGPSGGDRHKLRLAGLRIDHRVPKMPEVPLHRFMEHLVVAHGGLQIGVPIHQALAAINQAVRKHLEKRVPHRSGTHRVEREPRAAPVATATHQLQLAENSGFVLFLPLPDPLDERIAAKIVAA